jgi:hypothetical protein
MNKLKKELLPDESSFIKNWDSAISDGNFNEPDSLLSPEEVHWEKMFQMLIEFKEANGHCLGPLNYKENIFLWKWIEETRKGEYSIHPERKKRLNDIGFAWTFRDILWEKHFLKLVEFKNVYGHSEIPPSFNDLQIRQWINKQKSGKENLSDYRKKRLDSIGFSWDLKKHRWEKNFFKLIEFKKSNGHCNVPQLYTEDPLLGIWVSVQRQNVNIEWFTGRKKRLDEIGFAWNSADAYWEKQFQKLAEFKITNDHFNLPHNFDPTCKSWITIQRKNKENLDFNKRKKLDDIGFIWSPKDKSWDEMFSKLLSFKISEGHCNVPIHSTSDPSLSYWVSNQRARKETLITERIKRLEEIGFVWNPLDILWENKQRREKKKIFPDRIQRLDEIGFAWTPLEQRWEYCFQKLLEFKKKNGHCNVPIRLKEDPSFGDWVYRQREERRNLRTDRKKRLTEIGFNWNPNKEKIQKSKKAV